GRACASARRRCGEVAAPRRDRRDGGALPGGRRGRGVLRRLRRARQRREACARVVGDRARAAARRHARPRGDRRRRRGRRHGGRLGHPRAGRPDRGAGRTPRARQSGWSRNSSRGGDSVRVVIAEDSVLMREGVARLLEDEGFEIVGRAGNADDLLLKIVSYKPDVAVVDVRMPPTHTDEGARAAVTIRERYPDVGVLLLSQVIEATFALKLFSQTPASFGYLLKDRILEVDDFVDALKRVARGGTAVDPAVVTQLLRRTRPDHPVETLTER